MSYSAVNWMISGINNSSYKSLDSLRTKRVPHVSIGIWVWRVRRRNRNFGILLILEQEINHRAWMDLPVPGVCLSYRISTRGNWVFWSLGADLIESNYFNSKTFHCIQLPTLTASSMHTAFYFQLSISETIIYLHVLESMINSSL